MNPKRPDDYRDTGDVDAWWRTRQDADAFAVARELFAQTAAECGYSVRERTWGETVGGKPMGPHSDRDAGGQRRVEDDGAGRARRASRKTITVIDHSVYPDVEHGEGFEDDYDRADYVQRICAACDFGVPPDRDTVTLFRGWRDIFDRFPIPDSPSYHALRAHFRWAAVVIEPSFYPAPWETLDAIEGRDDPCKNRV